MVVWGLSLYRKPSSGNAILHAASSHPAPLVKSIPYSQYVRLKRNCSREFDFEKEVKALQTRLLAKGYSKTCLKEYHRENDQNREQLIQPKGAKAHVREKK